MILGDRRVGVQKGPKWGDVISEQPHIYYVIFFLTANNSDLLMMWDLVYTYSVYSIYSIVWLSLFTQGGHEKGQDIIGEILNNQ